MSKGHPESLEFKILRGAMTPEEIVALRRESEWKPRTVEHWEKTMSQTLCSIAARGTKKDVLLGAGFLFGSVHYGHVSDLVVKPGYRQRGIGGRILDELIKFTQDQGIEDVGITYDPKYPWLQGFYERHGFAKIDTGMELKKADS
jgi:ribosomal protein S18 acetylase RimI-like enzyme